jgi:ankyrin repeat protein
LENEGNILSYLKTLGFNSVLMPALPISLLVTSALRHTVMVKLLLEKGCNISTTDQKLLTSRHLASGNGYLDLVKLLLEKGANPNAVNESNDRSLYKAAENGHTEVA